MDPVSLDRMERLRRWAAIPVPARDEEWVREFEAAFWPTFLIDTERVTYGSEDQRPYRALRFPADEAALPGLEPKWARPASMVDDLLAKGQGLLLGESDSAPFCVMTLGEIVSYRLYGRAFALPLGTPVANAVAAPGENIQLQPPHESNFPSWARVNPRRHLRETLGVEAPRASWVQFPNGWAGLAFDLEPVDGTETKRRAAFEGLRAIMPRRLPYAYHPGLRETPTMLPF